MREPEFLTVAQVLAVHLRVIEEFGGDAAVLDEGLLESAVLMPAAQFKGAFLYSDLPAMAAAYLFHICKNHVFADGNKRTALAATALFLAANGQQFRASNRELVQLTLRVAEGKLSKEDLVELLRSRLGAIESSP